MIDGYGRTIDYVRISVTDRCNLRCVYCMPEEGVGSISHEEILRFGEIERVCQILAENGIQKIKLTGGEPLVRRRLPELAAALKRIPGIKSLTITTNGVLLEEMYDALADAGVDSVTISLDTLDASVYRQLTRRDEIEAVRRGLRTAIQKGRMQIKINCVPVLGIEEQKLLEVAELAKNHNVHVRFIEMMPIGIISMKRTCTLWFFASSATSKSFCSSIPSTGTQFILICILPFWIAVRRPRLTASISSRRVSCRYTDASSVSRLIVTESTPASASASYISSNKTPFVVIVRLLIPGIRFNAAANSGSLRRTSGSPPVSLIF